MPRTTSRVSRGNQVKANAAAKRARVEEAGLGGPRVGRSSATTRTAQARRDARADADRRASSAAPAKPAAKPAAKSAATSSTKPSKKPARDAAARRGGRN